MQLASLMRKMRCKCCMCSDQSVPVRDYSFMYTKAVAASYRDALPSTLDWDPKSRKLSVTRLNTSSSGPP